MAPSERTTTNQALLRETAQQRLSFLEGTVLPRATQNFKSDKRRVTGVGRLQQEILNLQRFLHETRSEEESPDPRTLRPTRGMLGETNSRLT